MPKQSYLPYFDQLSETGQPLYMTMSKQAQKTLSENTEKTFSANMPPFSSKGGAIIAEITVLEEVY